MVVVLQDQWWWSGPSNPVSQGQPGPSSSRPLLQQPSRLTFEPAAAGTRTAGLGCGLGGSAARRCANADRLHQIRSSRLPTKTNHSDVLCACAFRASPRSSTLVADAAPPLPIAHTPSTSPAAKPTQSCRRRRPAPTRCRCPTSTWTCYCCFLVNGVPDQRRAILSLPLHLLLKPSFSFFFGIYPQTF